jgi:hypothetical protein
MNDYGGMVRRLMTAATPVADKLSPLDERISGMFGLEGAKPYQGGSGPAPLPGGRARHNTLAPAVRDSEGRVYAAKPGEHHWDADARLTARGGKFKDDGWLDMRTGQYVTRDQADFLFRDQAGRIESYLKARANRGK